MDCCEKYVKERLEDQIKWHESKATENKNKFYGFQVIIIVAGALVPIINLVDFATFETRLISSILGGIIVGITSILQLKKHHENWIQYRSTEESLKREKYLYLCDVTQYEGLTDKEKCKKLVEHVESILSYQNSKFFDVHNNKSDS